ncbi:MAG: response regulator transcription factor [Acidobacteriaceae bacterium]|nr:response regulator transcription factor [Acidobacteriaceae bacterium]
MSAPIVRVLVRADSPARARRLADLLADEERLEVIESDAIRGTARGNTPFADVIVAAALTPDQIPAASVPVVLLAEEADAAVWGNAIHARLPLNAFAAEIAAAVMAAANDLTVLTSSQARRWLPGSEPNGRPRERLVEPLTPRELQVLRMLADGLGNKEIAGRLGISDHTAKFHVTQILAKLGAATRTEAVTIGIKRGLVPL